MHVAQLRLHGAQATPSPLSLSYRPGAQPQVAPINRAPVGQDVHVRAEPEHVAQPGLHGEHTRPGPESLSYVPGPHTHVEPDSSTLLPAHEVHAEGEPSHVPQDGLQGEHDTPDVGSAS